MKSSTFLKDFKSFAMKGNLIDMAVGVVIGGAFGKIVSSLVADVIMPLVGLLVGGVDFTSLSWTLKEATEDAEAVTLNYGTFIQNVFDFLVIAFSIFVFLRIIFNLSKKKEEQPAAPEPAPEPAPSKEEVLLAEIRDLLKENSSK
jgi:large conductance mechanosensitive channel